ncbi:MAG TPA: hypothetical protein VFD17_04255 [Clostridia bacterium]|nr:hypothetical protein [Clostridia bacterium]
MKIDSFGYGKEISGDVKNHFIHLVVPISDDKMPTIGYSEDEN